MSNTTHQIKPFHIWEGIYPNFKSAVVNARGSGFSGEVYRKRSLQAASECLTALESGNPIPPFHKQRSSQLPLIVAMMLSNKEKRVRVLDFGGGLGIGYMTLAESIPSDIDRIDYVIVEVPEVCHSGMNLLGGVVYSSDFPEIEDFDLIHAASSFQYVEHWQDLVAKFATLNPEYILLSDVFAGAIKSFVTLQNYYESRIPHWFLNLNELLDSFNQYGYRFSSVRLKIKQNQLIAGLWRNCSGGVRLQGA